MYKTSPLQAVVSQIHLTFIKLFILIMVIGLNVPNNINSYGMFQAYMTVSSRIVY